MLKQEYQNLSTQKKQDVVDYLTQETGMRERTVRAWLLEERNPAKDRQQLIANAMHMDVNYLFPKKNSNDHKLSKANATP